VKSPWEDSVCQEVHFLNINISSYPQMLFMIVVEWAFYGQTIIFLPCGFFFLSSFFPRLISAVADWMSAILPHTCGLSANLRCRSETCCTRLAANTGRKKVTKNRHRRTFGQLCWAISSQLRHISTIGKKHIKQQYLLQMSPQYGELRPSSGWDRSGSLGHPS